MERAKHIIMCVVLTFYFTNLKADYASAVYRSYINNNMTQWRKVIDEMSEVKGKSNEFLMELINYQYGYIAWCIGEGYRELAEKYLSEAENNLQEIEINRLNYHLYILINQLFMHTELV
jgi:hypothetical protein